MFLTFILQIVSEFFPISSSLLLRTFNMGSESILFHIFSGLLFFIIHFKYLMVIFLKPRQYWKTIIFYGVSTLPSVIVGYYTELKEIKVFSAITIEDSLLFNILSAAFLLLIIIRNKKKSQNLHYNKETKEEDTLSIIDGFYMGIFASLNGVFPGLSRLGMCLTYLLIKNKKLEKAYKIAIISSIPVLVGKPVVLLYQNSYYAIIFLDFIKKSYISILVSSAFIIYLHKQLQHLFSLTFLAFIMILRIFYYGSYLIYRQCF